jgi:hypothetical protein
VQRSEHEVAGLGCGQRGRDRLEVAHLADEDHVGVLAQRRAQGVRERRRVGPDLALVDDAALVPVQELDRVLDREDVLRPAAVDLVDDRCEGRRLTGACRPCYEHEAARLLREHVQRVRDAELLERLQLRWDEPESSADRLPLEVHVDAEAREPGDRVREVELTVQLEVLLLLTGEDPVQELLRLLRGERIEAFETLDFSTHANSRGCPRRHMEVGGIRLHHAFEQLVYRVRRRHNSNESSAGRGASFTRLTGGFQMCGNHPSEGYPPWGIRPIYGRPIRSYAPHGRST